MGLIGKLKSKPAKKPENAEPKPQVKQVGDGWHSYNRIAGLGDPTKRSDFATREEYQAEVDRFQGTVDRALGKGRGAIMRGSALRAIRK